MGYFLHIVWFGFSVTGLAFTGSTKPFEDKSNANYTDNDFRIKIENSGAYSLLFQNSTWLESAPTFFRFDNHTFSSKNGTLKLANINARHGFDTIGRFMQTTLSYVAAGHALEFDVMVKSYQDIPVILFSQYFIDGANWTQASSVDGVCSGFPGFKIQSTEIELGYLSFGGKMLGNHDKRIGLFNETSCINDGISGGPLAIFDEEGRTIILSSFSNFMAASFWQDSVTGGNLYGGIMGGIRHVPALYRLSFMAFYGSTVNKAFSGWGKLLCSYYGKVDRRKEDFSLNYLGYWTSRGMHYYYHTEPKATYEQTVLDIKDNGEQMKLPYRYFQYGPWWYYEGDDRGVKTWKAKSDVFPDGFSVMYHKLGLPSMASTKYWSNETTYAKQNGGKYDFIVQREMALPLDQTFWTDLFEEAKKWGLATYQQDFMSVQMNGIDQLIHDINLGRDWLVQMGVSAIQNNITIQYRMAYPRQTLQALEIPAVTQGVVADITSGGRWKVGITSLFAVALGIVPSQGPFLTVASDTMFHGNPEVSSLVATLSTGPVGVGDQIDKTNKSLLMKCCNKNGLILKPEHPAKALDKQVLKMAFPEIDGPSGEAWIAYSDISGLRFANLLVLDIENGTQFSVSQKDTGIFDHAGDMDLFSIPYNNPEGWGVFTTFGRLTFTSSCSVENFCLYHLATAIPDWFMTVIFGEMDKWVPVSPKRVLSISWTNETVTAPLKGATNETFDFWYMLGSKADMVTCTLNSTGAATFKMDNILGIATCD